MTFASLIGKSLPKPISYFLRPYWHKVRDYIGFKIQHKGRLYFDKKIGEWVAIRTFNNKPLGVTVRSYRQFRRYYQFGRHDRDDVVYLWMNSIDDCSVLYDIGSSNGLEGFLVNHLWGSKIVFVEPFTPSIETILKTIVLQGESKKDNFEVLQAGCDSDMGHRKLYMHHGPIPGVNRNSVGKPEDYDRGGRQDQPILCHQWIMSVSLDGMHWELDLPKPTHIKIDVDGFENHVLMGAKKLLEDGCVHSWAIELNGHENQRKIISIMEKSGYNLIAEWEHYPGYKHYSGDAIFVRQDLVSKYQEKLSKVLSKK
ncbi:MAG: hypothetical protein CMM30_02895 [Rhodospirillaceae bacterium]|nr:hypothetical protein [Alphaproteobacteria bacterium]MBR71873.1 hypothetical protein [Rhodospirillaceae bacterium]|tara:strand:- start:1841 stop:2776 length:936 start_codon:yes stop_codon:yes gene_type:complete